MCDDEAVLRMLVRATLQPLDYRIVEAADGDEAIERAKSERPDVIILDMMMPGQSGLAVLARIRGDLELENTPVLMVTARTQESDRRAASEGGADRFLSKPFNPHELAAAVDELARPRE